jgi:hypothetical protein
MLVQTVAGGLGNMRVPLHSRSAHHTVLRVERSAPALLTPYACKCFPRFSFWIWNA